MDFKFTDEQNLMRDTYRQFCEKELNHGIRPVDGRELRFSAG